MLRLSKKAQSTAEYAIIIGVVIGAVSIMQLYVKRGLQGRVKDVSDRFMIEAAGNGDLAASAPKASDGTTIYQYEPAYLVSDFTTQRDSQEIVGVNETTGEWKREIQDVAGVARDKITREAGGYQAYDY